MVKTVPKTPDYLLDEHLQDLRNSGLSDEIIAAAGIRTHLLNGSMHFPYFSFDGEKTTHERWKTFDANQPKYLQAANTGTHIYFPPAFKETLQNSSHIFITEGEKKTLSLADRGYCAVGLGGVHSWHRESHGPLHPDLVRLVKTHKPIYLVFDSDAKKKSYIEVQKAKKAFAQSLLENGAWEVSTISLPLGDEPKIGIDDWFLTHTDGEFEKLIEEAKRIEDYLPFSEGLEWLDKPDIEVEQFIEGLLCRGDKMQLGGGSKAYKTWLLLHMGLMLAAGGCWLGMRAKPCKVLYVNLELHKNRCRQRLRVILEATGLKPPEGNFRTIHLRGQGLTHDTLVKHILEEIKKMGIQYDTIIIDPVYKLLGEANENGTTDVTKVLNSFERLAQIVDCAVCYAHHQTKGNQSSKAVIDRVSGSGVFARDPDVLVYLTEHEDPLCFTVDTILRNLPPVQPFVVEWAFPLMQRAKEKNPAAIKTQNRKTYSDETVLAALVDGMDTKEWMTALGIDRAATMSAITKRLTEASKVISDHGVKPRSKVWHHFKPMVPVLTSVPSTGLGERLHKMRKH